MTGSIIVKNIFDGKVIREIEARLSNLNKKSMGLWGKMGVAQMLAHCNVVYETTFEDIHPRPNFFMKLILKAFVKKVVVGPKPYEKNNPTAPQFIIKDEKDFDTEKARLIAYLRKCEELGGKHFDNKESHSLGKLSIQEWNTLFYKHLDHHLRQFDV